jgi:hypothetical protein
MPVHIYTTNPEGFPNPKEDMAHAVTMLSHLTPEELLRATYAIEEIIEESPRWLQALRDRETPRQVASAESIRETLSEIGLDSEQIECYLQTGLIPAKAAPE